jgi:hypothetical protein
LSATITPPNINLFQAQNMPDLGQPNAPQPTTSDPTGGLEATAAQAPGQLGQSLQSQQQQNATPQQQPGQWSPDNPYATVAHQIKSQLDAIPVPQQSGGAIKQLLTNFLGGGGRAMMAEVGLPTPEQRRQQLQNSYLAFSQMADAHESGIADLKYKQVLTDSAQQANLYQSQLQPLELQRQRQQLDEGQQALQAGAQQIPSVRPSMSAGDLASLGVPADLSAQYAGKPLDEADMNAVKQMAAANQKQLQDYGQDGHGQGRGIWVVDKQFNPIKQISPISETSRSTNLARQQMQMQVMQVQSGQLGQDLVEGNLDPSQISPRAANYPYVLNAANQYSQAKYGKPFDAATAARDFAYAKSQTTQNTLKMINAMTDPGGSIEIAQTAAKRLPQFDSTTANQVFNATATQFGSSEASDFHTAMLGLADEYSKVMGGGVSSDTGRQQGLDLLKDAYSKRQLAGAIAIMQKDIQARKSAIIGNNTYLQRQYLANGGAQQAPQSGAPSARRVIDFTK